MKKRAPFIIIVSILSMLFLTGCTNDSTEKYVGEKIASMKEEDTTEFTTLLEEGIAKSNALYVLPFPEELREPYLAFLQSVFANVSFEVSAAEKRDSSHYSVKLTFAPIDIAASVKEHDTTFTEDLSHTDMITAMTTLLKEDAQALKETHIYQEETSLPINVEVKNGDYLVSEKSITELVETALVNPMASYNTVCDLFNVQNFLTAYLDAVFKGEMTALSQHLARTPEELQQTMALDLSAIPIELSDDQKTRYMDAIQSIIRQCRYSVGIPIKNADTNSYSADITFAPNNSISETLTAIQGATYTSSWDVKENCVQTLEHYAAAPAFGIETTQTIDISLSSIRADNGDTSDMDALCSAILPMPQL